MKLYNFICIVVIYSISLDLSAQTSETTNSVDKGSNSVESSSLEQTVIPDKLITNDEKQKKNTIKSNQHGLSIDQILIKASESQKNSKVYDSKGVKTRYWIPRYQKQVNAKVFDIIQYPYYPGGKPYSLLPGDPNEYDSGKEIYKDLTGESATDPNLPDITSLPALHPVKAIQIYETCMDLNHQWRSINESQVNTLEIVRAIELTKTQTHIYQTNPKLAVGVKRTLGQIGLINMHFDLTNRTIVEMIMTGRDPMILLSRLDKQLADLKSQYDRLALQNDQVSIALGMGKIDRSRIAFEEPVEFLNISSLEDKTF